MIGQLSLALVSVVLGTPFPDVRPDETLVFFPTEGWQVEGGQAWKIHIHGWIFETEWRQNLLGPLFDAFDLEEDADDDEGDGDPSKDEIVRGRDTFIQRAAPFLVDNQSGKKVKIKLGVRTFTLPPSTSDGHFEDIVRIDASEMDALRKSGQLRGEWLTFSAVMPHGDDRNFGGRVRLIDPAGISVVSDIDDTVKITNVGNSEEMFRCTFLLPFKAIAGMPELYTAWSNRPDVKFHFVSSSPWQLCDPLQQLLGPPGFPEGTFHLRRIRMSGSNLFKAFPGGEGHKRDALSTLLQRYPDRRFVLIGDDTERDPEIYSRLARDYPRQVVRIFIRDPNRDGSTPRYRKLFEGLPRETAFVFRDPRQLVDLLPARTTTSQPVETGEATTQKALTQGS